MTSEGGEPSGGTAGTLRAQGALALHAAIYDFAQTALSMVNRERTVRAKELREMRENITELEPLDDMSDSQLMADLVSRIEQAKLLADRCRRIIELRTSPMFLATTEGAARKVAWEWQWIANDLRNASSE
jgi:hypothetical protein